MKRRPPRALHTVGRPRAAAFFKAHMVGRMPIPGRKNRNAAGFRLGNPSIQYGNDGVAAGHSQGSAGTKVILNVDDQERVANFKAHIDIVILREAWTYAARLEPPRFKPLTGHRCEEILRCRQRTSRILTIKPRAVSRVSRILLNCSTNCWRNCCCWRCASSAACLARSISA